MIFGALTGMPVLLKTVAIGEQPNLYADVVYANFSLLPSNQSVPDQSGQLTSFLFVLNVTNLSNASAEVTSASVIMAGNIQFAGEGQGNITSIFNWTITNWGPGNAELWNNATQVRWQNPIDYGYSNLLMKSSESFVGNESQWNGNASELVALSGVVDLSNASLAVLQSGKFFVFSHVEGEAIDSGVQASGAYVIKGIQLKTIGNSDFLFNELLTDNRTLQVSHDGTGVFVASGT